jgi:hypothetical protein
MFDYEKDRLARLRDVLRSLKENHSTFIRARQLREDYLTGDGEYDQYRASLAGNRVPGVVPDLSPDAQAYWDAFRALCRRVNLASSRDQRNRLVDEAAELMGQYEALTSSDQGRFRALNLSQGDTKWANALHLLEHELPFLDDDAARPGHLDRIENFTQRQFLTDLLHRLDPPEQEASAPEEDALLKQRQQNLRDMIKRLRR